MDQIVHGGPSEVSRKCPVDPLQLHGLSIHTPHVDRKGLCTGHACACLPGPGPCNVRPCIGPHARSQPAHCRGLCQPAANLRSLHHGLCQPARSVVASVGPPPTSIYSWVVPLSFACISSIWTLFGLFLGSLDSVRHLRSRCGLIIDQILRHQILTISTSTRHSISIITLRAHLSPPCLGTVACCSWIGKYDSRARLLDPISIMYCVLSNLRPTRGSLPSHARSTCSWSSTSH